MIGTYDADPSSQRRSIFPVKGCMFFGVPHRGADVASTASKFLSVLGHVMNVNTNNIKDLKPKSQRFANISSQFRTVRSEHAIPVISFFETVKYNHTLGLVSRTSFLVYYKAVHSRIISPILPQVAVPLKYCPFHTISFRPCVPSCNISVRLRSYLVMSCITFIKTLRISRHSA